MATLAITFANNYLTFTDSDGNIKDYPALNPPLYEVQAGTDIIQIQTTNRVDTKRIPLNYSSYTSITVDGVAASSFADLRSKLLALSAAYNPSASSSNSTSGDTEYRLTPTGDNADGQIVYTSATTLTVTGLSYTFNKYDIKSIKQIPSSGKATYFSETNDFTVVAGVITVAGAAFAATDTFEAYIAGQKKAFYESADTIKNTNQNLDSDKAFSQNVVDTTNIAATTHYYFSSVGQELGSFRDLSFSGKFIDADGTLTLSVEATNDEDTTSGDWVQVYFYDDKNNTTVNSLTITNGTLTFACSLNNINFDNYRYKVVASGATNTVIIKERKKAI